MDDPEVANARLAELAMAVDPQRVKHAYVDLTNQTAAASADTVVAAVTAKKIRVIAMGLSVSLAAVVSLQSNAVRISEQWWSAAYGGRERGQNAQGYYETVAGEALKCLCNAGGGGATIGGIWIQYIEI